MVSATTTTDNKSETEKKTNRMNIRIKPTGMFFGCGNGEYEKLELRVGEIVLGTILGSCVMCENQVISGDSIPVKIQEATGCTHEDAVEVIRVYGECFERLG